MHIARELRCCHHQLTVALFYLLLCPCTTAAADELQIFICDCMMFSFSGTNAVNVAVLFLLLKTFSVILPTF